MPHKNTIDTPSNPLRVVLRDEKTRGWGLRNFTTSCVECAELGVSLDTGTCSSTFLGSGLVCGYVVTQLEAIFRNDENKTHAGTDVEGLAIIPSNLGFPLWIWFTCSAHQFSLRPFNCSCVRTVLQLQRCGLEVGMLSYILLEP